MPRSPTNCAEQSCQEHFFSYDRETVVKMPDKVLADKGSGLPTC
jgi:hypothetical protein